MATPIGHALAGCAVALSAGRGASRPWRVVVLCVAYAIAPDLDFLPGVVVGMPALYHQGVSHSMIVAALAACVGALVFARGCGLPTGTQFGLLFAAYGSHLVIDMFGPDQRPPLGVPLLWPFSSLHFRSPVTFLLGVRHASTTDTGLAEWARAVLSGRNLLAIGLEVAVVGPVALLVAYFARRRSDPRRSGRRSHR